MARSIFLGSRTSILTVFSVGSLLGISLLAGCGGGGGQASQSSSCPYAGSYSGPWQDNAGQSGTYDVTVNSGCSLNGTITNTLFGTTSLNGSVDKNTGYVQASYSWLGITYALTGSISNGHFTWQGQ